MVDLGSGLDYLTMVVLANIRTQGASRGFLGEDMT